MELLIQSMCASCKLKGIQCKLLESNVIGAKCTGWRRHFLYNCYFLNPEMPDFHICEVSSQFYSNGAEILSNAETS